MPTSKNSLLRNVWTTLLSVWIVYHVLVIAIIPNGTSFIGRNMQDFFVPYATSLGMNTSWNFFSPDPAHTMYIRYTVKWINEMGDNAKEPVEGFYPEAKDQGIWDLRKKRDMYVMRYMVMSPKRLDVMLGPWLCQQNPGATDIKIEHIVDSIPNLDMAIKFQDHDLHELSSQMEYINHEYKCSQMKDEIAI